MVRETNNWGRWGDADKRGALNLLTPDVVRVAASCVREGRALGLSLPIVTAHGTTTHMDALCHRWAGEELYNGHPAVRVRSYGAARCGIDKAGPVVARGVLFDVPELRGARHLAAGVRISAADLVGCGVKVGPGDVAVVRTGWPLTWEESREACWPGLSAEAGRWLAERDVSMVACEDAAISGLNEHQLADEDLDDGLHSIFLWRHGVHVAEMRWLEEPAETGRTEFRFVTAPLKIEGGTGSPINPIAVL
jgi:kynurenine formamidase